MDFSPEYIHWLFDSWIYPFLYVYNILNSGAKDDWDFQISDLVKNPDGTDI